MIAPARQACALAGALQIPTPGVIPIHLLTGLAAQCPVPRELMFDLAPDMRADKPLWAWDEVFDVIDAMEEAGAAVVQGEILVVPEGGGASRMPWEPWLPPPYMQVTPLTRRWWCKRNPGEPWETFVARAAAYARERAPELAGSARVTPEGAVHVDLAWATRDELALFDVPGGIGRARRRQQEQGAGPWAWMYGFSMRPRSIGKPAPGSYWGSISTDLNDIPDDARYASFSRDSDNLGRLAELTSLEALSAAATFPKARTLLGRLPRLRELRIHDFDMTSLEPLAGLSALEFAYIDGGPRLRDPGPLAELPALRYLFLDAGGMRDLSGMAAMTQLTSLHLSAAAHVDSLAPLGGLANLRCLSVWCDDVRDGSTAPLARLRGLKSLHAIPERLPLEERARLAAALPHVEGAHRSPLRRYAELDIPHRCERCRGDEVYFAAGKRRRVLCVACDATAIHRHVARWEILLSAATAARSTSPGPD
jgi:hypothetical protein